MPNSDHFQEFKPLLLPGNDFIKKQQICKENIFGKLNAKRKEKTNKERRITNNQKDRETARKNES